MTVYADPQDSAPSDLASKAARALALAGAALVCVLMGTAATVTLLGGGPPVSARIALSPPPVREDAPMLRAEPTPDTPMPAIKAVQRAGRALIADPALIENTPLGPLPRIADDGRKPMQAYAAPAANGKFRIAIVVMGLGLSAKATQAAISSLPPAVTVGLLP